MTETPTPQGPPANRRRVQPSPFDRSLINSPVFTRTRAISITEMSGEELPDDIDECHINLRLLRIITPAQEQVVTVYSKNRRGPAANNNRGPSSKVQYNRLFLCSVVGSTVQECRHLVYVMQQQKSLHKNIWHRSLEYRDNGVITIGRMFRLLQPHKIDSEIGGIPCVSSDLAAIVMEDAYPLLSVPIDLGASSSSSFVLNGATIKVRRTLPLSTNCSGFFCDRQRVKEILEAGKGCGCYHVQTYLNPIAITHDIHVTPANADHNIIKVLNFSSMKFTSIYMKGYFNKSVDPGLIQLTNSYWTLRTCVKKIETLVNDNGGWTVIGWYKRGMINDKSLLSAEVSVEVSVEASVMTHHIVSLFPTNPAFRDESTDLFTQLNTLRYQYVAEV